jgi:hypothetical protein
MPVMFWAVLRYAGISEGWTMVEAMTVWGYSMFVWIPVSVCNPSLVHSTSGTIRLLNVLFSF